MGYLHMVIEKRFDIQDLSSEYFHLPIASSGMELHNPMIRMLSAETATWNETAEKRISGQMKRDKESYNAQKAV